MQKLILSFIVGLVAVGSTVQLRAQSADPVTLVKAGRLLDPRTGDVLSPAAVLIEGNKIKQVGSPDQISTPQSTTIIDLGRATLLPGLIDSHTHVFIDIIVPPGAETQRHANGEFAPGLLLAIVESPTERAFMGALLRIDVRMTGPQQLEVGKDEFETSGSPGIAHFCSQFRSGAERRYFRGHRLRAPWQIG
jgi:hypothetical protein